MIGLDPENGRLLWSHGTDRVDYSTPVIVESGDRRQVIVAGSLDLVALAPKSGRRLWSHRHSEERGFDPTYRTPAHGLRYHWQLRRQGAFEAQLVKSWRTSEPFLTVPFAEDGAYAIEVRAAELPGGLRQKLLDRLEELAPGVELDPARLAQEATFLADRADVTEELVRLRSHLEQLAELLGEPDGEPVDKRLEFLIQEVHRENNTIGSKSADLELSRWTIEMKSELEKVREQIQNLE